MVIYRCDRCHKDYERREALVDLLIEKTVFDCDDYDNPVTAKHYEICNSCFDRINTAITSCFNEVNP